MRRQIAAYCLALLIGCAASDDISPPPPMTPETLTLPASARDSNATLDSLDAFTARVDADTTQMIRIQRQLELGAGSTALVTAWRADTVWQRLRVDATGTDFRSSDTYWLHHGAVVGAELTMIRPDQQPAIERVWFRGATLYRWVDSRARRLAVDAQSTKTEVEMLRARIDRVVQQLPAAADNVTIDQLKVGQ